MTHNQPVERSEDRTDAAGEVTTKKTMTSPTSAMICPATASAAPSSPKTASPSSGSSPPTVSKDYSFCATSSSAAALAPAQTLLSPRHTGAVDDLSEAVRLESHAQQFVRLFITYGNAAERAQRSTAPSTGRVNQDGSTLTAGEPRESMHRPHSSANAERSSRSSIPPGDAPDQSHRTRTSERDHRRHARTDRSDSCMRQMCGRRCET